MVKDMTKGSPMKLILGFAIPMLMGMLFQQFYNLVDTMIVGKTLGVDALAGVGATACINFMIIGFCMGVCNGFAIPVAQQFGAGKYSELRKYVYNGYICSIIFSVVLTVASVVGCRGILTLLRTPSNIYEHAYAYIVVIFAGIPTVFLYNMVSGVIRSLGDSKTPVYFLVVSAVINIILDFVFILVFKMGVAGAAWATDISQLISGVACYVYMNKKYDILKFQKQEKKFKKVYVKNLCINGIPMGLQFSITAIGTIIVQGAVNIYGPVHMAGFSAAGKIQNIFATVFTAFGATIATYVGQNRGAGKMDRVKQGVRYTQMMVLGWSVFVMFLMFFFGKYLTYLFVDPSEQDVVNVSVTYFRTVFWAYPFLGSIFLYRNTLQGMGYGLVPMLGGVFELVARTGIVVLIAGHTSFAGVCMADPTAWIAALIPLIPYYFHVMKKYKNKSQVQVVED